VHVQLIERRFDRHTLPVHVQLKERPFCRRTLPVHVQLIKCQVAARPAPLAWPPTLPGAHFVTLPGSS